MAQWVKNLLIMMKIPFLIGNGLKLTLSVTLVDLRSAGPLLVRSCVEGERASIYVQAIYVDRAEIA